MTINPFESTSQAETQQDNARDVPAPQPSIQMDVINVLRGFCMGAADTVPGVSGGTVALILGHYHQLVQSISRVDSTFLKTVSQRRIGEAATYLNLRFLIALGLGIAVGIVTLAKVMHWLLDHRLPETLAVFLGLMVASVWIVKSYVGRWKANRWVALAGGAAVAMAISAIPQGDGNMSLPYLFGSATVAICAMILPGISGAFVLVLFGVYHEVTGLIKEAARGNITVESATQIGVFACGCLVGLLAFSRLLRWMLEHHRDLTMAGLMGLMIGSLGKLWPLQVPTPQTATQELKFRVMQYVPPSQWEGSLFVLAGLAVGAAIVVIVAEKFASTRIES